MVLGFRASTFSPKVTHLSVAWSYHARWILPFSGWWPSTRLTCLTRLTAQALTFSWWISPFLCRLDLALWSGTNKNRDGSTGPLARPFARSLPRSWDSELLMSHNDLVLSHSASFVAAAERKRVSPWDRIIRAWPRFRVGLLSCGGGGWRGRGGERGRVEEDGGGEQWDEEF